MKKVCPRCGATFECMHDNIVLCHCVTVKLDALQRACLKEKYSDCLCHECLKTFKESFYVHNADSITYHLYNNNQSKENGG